MMIAQAPKNIIAFMAAAGVSIAHAQQCNPGFRTKFFNVPGPLPGDIGPGNTRLQELGEEVTGNGEFTTSDGGVYMVSNFYEGEAPRIRSVSGLFGPPFQAGVVLNDFIGNAVATVEIPPGTWTLRVESDDGNTARLDGITFDKCYANNANLLNELCPTGQGGATEIGFIGATSATLSAGVFTVDEPTTTTLTVNYFQGGGDRRWSVAIFDGDSQGAEVTGFNSVQDGQDEWRVFTCLAFTYDCSLKWWRRAFKLLKCLKTADAAGGFCDICPNDEHWFNY